MVGLVGCVPLLFGSAGENFDIWIFKCCILGALLYHISPRPWNFEILTLKCCLFGALPYHFEVCRWEVWGPFNEMVLFGGYYIGFWACPPVVHLLQVVFILFTTQPGKCSVKFNVNWPRSVWCHFDWQPLVGTHLLAHLLVDVTSFKVSRVVRVPNINKVTWPTSCQSTSDTKLSAAGFYRRFPGWVIKDTEDKREGDKLQVGVILRG